MSYEPLNLQNGQTLTAEDLQHMEQGIAGVLPQNPGAYQYPATDGDGNMVWADRLAYAYRQNLYVDFEMNGQVTDEPTVYSFTGTQAQFDDSFEFDGEKGTNYKVVFDGNTFTCTCQRYVGEMDSSYWTWVIGNPALITRSVPSAIWDESDEPFVFYGYAQGGSAVYFIETTEDSEHTIQVSFASAEETVKTIDPKFLRTVVNLDTLTKAQAIEYAMQMANVAAVGDRTFYPLLGYSIMGSSAGDDCCGCGPQSAKLQLSGNGNYNVESFDITDEEYNQIASAWGLS